MAAAAAAGCPLTRDQLTCPVCLDLLLDPVSTPCGHNFCKKCIEEHWKDNVRCKCPICNQVFHPKPNLRVNTLISKLVDKSRQATSNVDPRRRAQNASEVLRVLIPWVACASLFVIVAVLTQSILLKLERVDAEIEQMIQEGWLTMEEFKLAAENSKKETRKQLEEGFGAFVALKESVETEYAKLLETIRQQERTREEEAEGQVKHLEKFIQVLQKKKVELFSIPQMQETLSDMVGTWFLDLVARAKLRSLQHHAVDITLDPETAHPSLLLSEDGKWVRYSNVRRHLPDNPERFSACANVLGKQSFSSGRFYFEVEVKGKSSWGVGVARQFVNRKGRVTLSPQNGYWTVWLRGGADYEAHADPAVHLTPGTAPQKVGVFVDYEEALVSFYDVDSAALLYTFTRCSFIDTLHPFFSPFHDTDVDSAPLIIAAVERPPPGFL